MDKCPLWSILEGNLCDFSLNNDTKLRMWNQYEDSHESNSLSNTILSNIYG